MGVLQRLLEHPVYLRNLDWGRPRYGHPEGSLRVHIAMLEANLAQIIDLVPDLETDLRLLIHVHDICKPDAERGLDCHHPKNHANLASQLLGELDPQSPLLEAVRRHDEGYNLYVYYRHSDSLNERLQELILAVEDLELFLLFHIIDSCVPGKQPDPLGWFLMHIHRVRAVTPRVREAYRRLASPH